MEDLTVLLADDDAINRLGVKAILENLGFKYILEAEDGAIAKELAAKFKPNLLIFDINMPKLDGLTAIEQIYENHFIPAIIISAYHDEELIKRASAIGVNYYLIKPIDENNLKIAIEITRSKNNNFEKIKEELEKTKEALNNRIFIEKAKGILMKRGGITEQEAMKKLQRLSNTKNIKISEVAKRLIEAENLGI